MKAKVVYIGTLAEGGTSRMRCDVIRAYFQNKELSEVDNRVNLSFLNKIWQSLAFRFKIGPVIFFVNRKVCHALKEIPRADLIWVDKAIYLRPSTTKLLRAKTSCLVHYTPDPAFTYHQSRFFRRSIKFYNHLITTKMYELDIYKKYLNSNALLHYSTQGFTPALMTKDFDSKSRKLGVVFIGHYEKERAEFLQAFLDANIPVVLVGIHWAEFVNTNTQNPNLEYLGNGVFGKKYIETLSSCWFGFGALSQWVPELHTTRTFEIPACGTILLTERNKETKAFFEDDEVVFYDSKKDLINKIKTLMQTPEKLSTIGEKGRKRVLQDGRDYASILKVILNKIQI